MRSFLRALVRTALEEVLEAEMTQALGAAKSERTVGRLGYRSGYYGRTLITRIGKFELRMPQDREGRSSRDYRTTPPSRNLFVEANTLACRRRPLHPRRNTNPARLREGFQPNRNIHTVTENVAVLDDNVALMGANAQFNLFRGGCRGIATDHRLLHLGSAEHHAGKLDQQSVPGGLYQSTTMCRYLGSISSRRRAFSRASMPSSSAPFSRL